MIKEIKFQLKYKHLAIAVVLFLFACSICTNLALLSDKSTPTATPLPIFPTFTNTPSVKVNTLLDLSSSNLVITTATLVVLPTDTMVAPTNTIAPTSTDTSVPTMYPTFTPYPTETFTPYPTFTLEPTPTNIPVVYSCDADRYNCSSFDTHQEAVDVFEYCWPISGDIHRLDGNNDGVPCE